MNGWLYAPGVPEIAGLDVRAAERPVLIVFDLDGTLANSAELARVLFKRVFALLGFGEISDELADSFNGPSADEVCRRMGIPPARRPAYNRLVDEIEIELVGTVGRAFPGIVGMLDTLSRHAALAVLTNGAPKYCEASIREYGFSPYIALSSGYVHGVTKAERIARWERETGARRVIVVGDHDTDIANARAAGAYAIGVTYGMGSREELRDADCLCDTPQQVAEACMKLIAQG